MLFVLRPIIIKEIINFKNYNFILRILDFFVLIFNNKVLYSKVEALLYFALGF